MRLWQLKYSSWIQYQWSVSIQQASIWPSQWEIQIIQTSGSCKKSKLKYIPLYSPAPCHRRHISNDSNLSDETTIENSWTETSRRRLYLESLLCDVSFLSPENSRPLTPDMKKYMMPVKRTSHLSKYLNTPAPWVLTSAKSIELMEEKEKKKQEKLGEKK